MFLQGPIQTWAQELFFTQSRRLRVAQMKVLYCNSEIAKERRAQNKKKENSLYPKVRRGDGLEEGRTFTLGEGWWR